MARKQGSTRPGEPEEHGAPGSWKYCKCRTCLNAHNTYYEQWRKNRDGRVPHGTAQGYQSWGCRCDECREAAKLHRDEVAARRHLARFGLDLDDVVGQSTASS